MMTQDLTAPVLAIDGPSGAGKGTIAQLVASRLGWSLLDSGALYRLTALSAAKSGIAFDDEVGLAHAAANLNVRFLPGEKDEPVNVLLDGEDVTRMIRTEEAGNNASKVAPFPSVRSALLQTQRNFQQQPGLVADGRDMGTVVFPTDPVKVFLTASAEARAERRFKQLKAKGESVKLAALLQAIEERDVRDSSRENAPLKAASDARIIDTTDFSIEDVLEQVLGLVADYC